MPAVGAATFWMNGRPAVEPLRARSLPLLLAVLAFAAGILCARHYHPPGAVAASVAGLGALACISLRRSSWTAWFAVLGLWLGAGCWCAQLQLPIDQQRELHSYADGLIRTVRGEVVAIASPREQQPNRGEPYASSQSWQLEPGAWEHEAGEVSQTVDLSVREVEEVTADRSTMRPVHGGLRLTFYGDALVHLRCGDVLEVPVRLREPEIYRDPGAFSYSDWLLDEGIGALASAKSAKLHVLHPGRPDLRCRMQEMQHWAGAHLESLPSAAIIAHMPAPIRLTAEDAAMLAAMLFGDRTQLSSAQRAGFERTGTFHLFVVSGLHVALLTGALFWLLRKLRLPEVPAVALTIALALLYALFTGFGVPAQRALAMSSLFLIARALDRQRSALNALGAAALLILVADPRALYEPSFQMTALVILAVGGLALPVSERLLQGWRVAVHQLQTVELDAFLPPRVAARRVALRLWGGLCRDLLGRRLRDLPALTVRAGLLMAEAVLFSAAIEVCMALPMALYFHRAVPMALPGNLLIAPVAMLLAGCGVATFSLSLLSPWLAAAPAVLTALLLHAVQAVVGHLGRARVGDVRIPGPSLILIGVCGLTLALAVWALRHGHPALAWCGAAMALLLPAVVLWPVHPALHTGALEVTAIDVGQGDSLLVVSPEGRTMLVDAGGPVGRIQTRWDVGEQVVAPFLWTRQIRRLDAVVLTHAHSDHIGGMPAILNDLRPRELWLSIEPGRSSALRALLVQAHALGIAVHPLAAGDHFQWGGVNTTVLAPERGYANPGEARNDDSLVLRLDWQRASVLLEGDAEAPSETAMLAHGRLHPVTLLKVGHHGSRTSTNPDFLSAVAPRDAVISVGQHNTFGHPRAEVLERLEAAHVRTFRTDRFGAETLLLFPDGSVTARQAYN